MNRTPIIYLNPRFDLVGNFLRILAAKEIVFPRERVPRRKIRWVRTSGVGGYWSAGG